MRPGSKIAGVRWVETDKGTPEKPKVRSWLVAQEFATEADPLGELFAPTPPLAATRWVMSGAASRGRRGPGEERLMLLDFKKAFLYADIDRELYIELPEDDDRRQGGANVGLLNKAMYGTRDAPAAWSRLVRKCLWILVSCRAELQLAYLRTRLRESRLSHMWMISYVLGHGVC